MSTLSTIYNKAAERREQSLDFIGQERRKIILDMQKEEKEFQANQALIKRLEDIKKITRLA